MTSERPEPEVRPTAPGYGDQGPAGGGRDEQSDAAGGQDAEPEPRDPAADRKD